MDKISDLYLSIFLLWAIFVVLSVEYLIQPFFYTDNIVVIVLVYTSTLFLLYFWLNGVKDLLFPLWYYLFCREDVEKNITQKPLIFDEKDTVDVIYCTYNDFNQSALSLSINNIFNGYDRDLVRIFILDDSTNTEYIQTIDDFCEKHSYVKVIRRSNREGFKAGNINNWFFALDKPSDFFIILDSDEVVPENFVLDTKKYMEDSSVGVVQANHKVESVYNNFDSMYARGVESHWITYQSVKDEFGFLSLLGHGALVRSSVFQEVGGFPHMVAEDLCFSINIRDLGYYVKFAPEVLCYEEYPVNYLAFKKRHNKWTQGNMEFIKKYTWKIITSKMSWFEKIDIFLFTYNLPLSAAFSLYLVINVILFPLLNFDLNYALFLLIPTIIMLVAPLLSDLFYYWRSPLNIIWYSFHAIMLYGSMFFISIVASLKSFFGKSVFLVTPKTSSEISLKDAFFANKGELIFSGSLLLTSYYTSNSVLPVLLIVIPSISSVYLSIKSN